uniref:MSP domain-containing protein n=1 Tax=Steinernema glaseri TaxID=37863 RepID=A0A1I7ZC85_9BILA
MVVAMDPPSCQVSATGGTSTHHVVNQGAARLAFKVKSSNNAQYRIKPVYGFVDEGARTPVDVIRQTGPPKEDKLVVQYAEVPPEETDPRAPFLAGAVQGEVVMTLNAA